MQARRTLLGLAARLAHAGARGTRGSDEAPACMETGNHRAASDAPRIEKTGPRTGRHAPQPTPESFA